MYEKVNPSHPDKVADRIAGAIVDVAYKMQENPKVAVEVLIGHNNCTIINETSVSIPYSTVYDIVTRISRSSNINLNYYELPQDVHLAHNQDEKLKCGDNGIFKGVPTTDEQFQLTSLVNKLYKETSYDGKLIMCQSNASHFKIEDWLKENKFDEKMPLKTVIINPLGDWTGGLNVDTGAVNRKLGSDMGDGVTGGGLHGKDLSKADVSVNIYAFLKAQMLQKPVEIYCAIGDDKIDGKDYEDIVNVARRYIEGLGGFEKFAEWGLIR